KHGNQLFLDHFIPRSDVPFSEKVLAAVTIGNKSTGFSNHDQARRHIPWVEVALPIAVDPPSRDPGKIESGCTKSAQAGNMFLHRTGFFPGKATVATAVVR